MKAWKKCILLLTALFVYLSFGAIIIVKFEETNVNFQQRTFFKHLADFIDNHYACGVTPDELMSFLGRAGVARSQAAFLAEMAHYEQGVHQVWSWPNSILFAFSVVTTIGYGRLAPKTTSGQVFCMFYLVFGIPLCCAMLSAIGDTFNVLWERFVGFSDVCFVFLKSKKARRFLMGVMTLSLLWILLALLPALVFTKTEPSWSLWRAQYFCFVSVSTIGFGDVMFAVEPEGDSYALDWVYKMVVLVYLLLSLSLISIVYTGIWHSQQKNINRAKKSLQRQSKRGIKNKSYDLAGAEAAESSFRMDRTSGRQKLLRNGKVMESVYDVMGDVSASENLGMKNKDSSDVILLSYRLTLPGSSVAELDSGCGSFLEIREA